MRTDFQLRGDEEAMPYRQCVGIMLFNRYGLVWVGRRLPKWAGEDDGPFWQMPQGGIAKGEQPKTAALRELNEETSVSSVEVLDEIPEWLSYDLPSDLLGVALKGKYRGQQQRWFAMRLTGPDSEINIRPRGQKQEFDAWRWARIEEVPELIIPYKRGIYQRIVREFAYLAG